jgi:hypothetical protein
MFSDRINRIDLIFFYGFQMKPRKRNSASAEKRAWELNAQHIRGKPDGNGPIGAVLPT